MRAQIDSRTRARIHTHMHTCARAHTHTHTHTPTYTRIYTPVVAQTIFVGGRPPSCDAHWAAHHIQTQASLYTSQDPRGPPPTAPPDLLRCCRDTPSQDTPKGKTASHAPLAHHSIHRHQIGRRVEGVVSGVRNTRVVDGSWGLTFSPLARSHGR